MSLRPVFLGRLVSCIYQRDDGCRRSQLNARSNLPCVMVDVSSRSLSDRCVVVDVSSRPVSDRVSVFGGWMILYTNILELYFGTALFDCSFIEYLLT